MPKKTAAAKAPKPDTEAPITVPQPVVLAFAGPLPPLPSDTPSNQAYPELNVAFHFFNHALFQGRLPFPMFVLHRSDRYLGHYSPKRYVNRSENLADEIMLNASSFALNSVEDIMSTLVHEMVHQFQNHTGSPGRRGYHNAEWAQMMIQRGLCPSTTGREGGKQTGESVSHYIIEGGPFQLACRELLQNHQGVIWFDRHLVRRDKLVVLSYPKDAPNDAPQGASSAVQPSAPAAVPPLVQESHHGPVGDSTVTPSLEGQQPIDGDRLSSDPSEPQASAGVQSAYADDPVPARPGPPPPPPMAARTRSIAHDLPNLALLESPPSPPKQTRAKLACPHTGCKAAVWGKPSVFVICGDHAQRMLVVAPQASDDLAPGGDPEAAEIVEPQPTVTPPDLPVQLSDENPSSGVQPGGLSFTIKGLVLD